MEIRHMLSRKSTKLLILLVINMLVVAASAAIYYGMILEPSVTITPALVQFVSGDDWPGSSSLGNNGTWASLSLNAYPNVTVVYEEPINVSNTDSSAHYIRLRHVSITPASGDAAVSNFTKVAFILVAQNGSSIASFNYTTTDDNWDTWPTMDWQSLDPSTQWTIRIEITTAASANGNVTVNIQIALDVKE
ncbi:MAG: hypothetical protein QW279_06035 [Candidatus Jordarchaeaceae archaeon]